MPSAQAAVHPFANEATVSPRSVPPFAAWATLKLGQGRCLLRAVGDLLTIDDASAHGLRRVLSSNT